MTKQKLVILSGVGLIVGILIISFIFFGGSNNEELLKKEGELKAKQEMLDVKIKELQIQKDSLVNIITYYDSVIKAKENNIPLIKEKYDKKIETLTTSPADTISKFLLNRYK
jgi:hypothetical protein